VFKSFCAFIAELTTLIFRQEDHGGPEIAHLNTKTLHDKEQVIL
jgi:hypothetical protein